MLQQIVYDQGSTVYEYLSSNGLAEDGQAYIAANSLMEELEEGNLPDQPQEHVSYMEYFQRVRFFKALDLLFGRLLLRQYTLRSSRQYNQEGLVCVAGCLLLAIALLCVGMGLKLAILILCGLCYMTFGRLRGSSLVDLISELEHPSRQLLQILRDGLQQIKQAEYVERSLSTTDLDIDGLLAGRQGLKLSTYRNLWIEQRTAIGCELKRVLQEVLSCIRKAATSHPQYLAKYATLQQRLAQTPTGSLMLDSLKQCLQMVYLLHRELKQIAVGILLHPNVGHLQAFRFVICTDRIFQAEKEAAESMQITLISRQCQQQSMPDLHHKPPESPNQANISYCLQRVSYVRQLLLSGLCSDFTAHQHMYQLTLNELKSLWKYIHELRGKLQPTEPVTGSDNVGEGTELSAGRNPDLQLERAQQLDYQLVLTQAGRQIHFKNREMDRIADQLQHLLFRKHQQNQMRSLNPHPKDERIRFNFITELKTETDCVVLE